MNFLLDTHTLIWSSISPSKLSERVRGLLKDVDNCLFLSIASIWECKLNYKQVS